MAKFNYKLQSVLEIKRKLENQEKIEYGLASAKVQEERDKLQAMMLQKAGYDKQARTLVRGKINVLEMNTCRKAIETMKSRIRTQMIEVQKAEKQLDEVRKRLNEVMVERKTYEKLRDKKFEEFKQELLYEEKKEVDELVSYTYHQNEE